MKAARLFLFFILALLITTAVLSFMMPTSQKVERSVVINSTATEIYDQIIKLENFHKFSVWSQHDSSIIYKLNSKDGIVGAVTTWKGSPEISGEGKIEIVALEPNRKVVHQLQFFSPKKMKAKSIFTLSETERSVTTVNWTFELATPRPWNIFNLMYSLEKNMASDFEDGLQSLKSLIETKDSIQTDPSAIN